ncbi:MAG: hypothetical protein LUD25_00555 [Coriobacteriaceae bacterium]|nr:hypothetical protein [Coriobacteriaceae bacterium]
MDEDAVAALYDGITKDLERSISNDKQIQAIQKRIAKGTATHKDTQQYALRLGKLTSRVLQRNITVDTIPNGDLSYHIMQGTVGNTLRDNLTRVNAVGGVIQDSLNEKAGLGLKAVAATLNSDRVNGIVSLMDDCDDLDQAQELMGEPVVNCTQSYADDVVKENAIFQYNAGLSPKIVRTAEAGCCDWCAGLEGTYTYPDIDDERDTDIFLRHQYCRCTMEYDPNNGAKQNVWTRKWTYQKDTSAIEERKKIGLK